MSKATVFRLETAHTSYWFRVTAFGHLEHIYFGAQLPGDQDIAPLLHKRAALLGSSVVYDESDPTYCMDTLCLEWSGIGKGDYRHSPAEIKMPDAGFTSDFLYQSHRYLDGACPASGLPGACAEDPSAVKTLEITLRDESCDVVLLLYYSAFHDTDVYTRRAVLINNSDRPLTIRKLMSLSLDIPNDSFCLSSFDGGWIKEGHKHTRPVSYGIHVISSTTGASSNRHNPGFLISTEETSENHGKAYGFNLVYSGNHYSAVELSSHDLVRIATGINPHCFEWTLAKGEQFETPEAMLSYSDKGFNGLSQNFHAFINEHLVRGDWKGKERPILINSWEAFFFKFTQGKLLRLARRAKKLGIELFVLDDGWFGKRDNDTAGLGDYSVNRRKLPFGLAHFAKRIHRMGLLFGLWFEPEMINEDSDLFSRHPEYALSISGRKPAKGRNQLVLDLANPEVRDYIVEKVSFCIDEARVDYVKWDCNRHISDAYSACLTEQGRFFHSYVLGLYDVLARIFYPRPHILLESCSSGGNRFDAGMLCFSPQIWASDDTDPVERLKIQGGLSYLYPPSSMGAHVSDAPHQQTMRDTPLTTRFNAAVFGLLGYEMDLKYLSYVQRKEIKEQIAFYKENRQLCQYGRFYRGEKEKDNKVVFYAIDSIDQGSQRGVAGFFQTIAQASEGFDRLRLPGFRPDKRYRLRTRPQSLFIRRFGGLVKHILPVTLDSEGFILRALNRVYRLYDCVEDYLVYGRALEEGVLLNNQFVGSYYNESTRLLGDFGSNLYVIEEEM